MSEESLKHSAKTVEEARKKVDEVPIMPFDGDAPPETPEESGGAVAEHGQNPMPDADRPVDGTGDDHAAEDADRGVEFDDPERG